MSGLVALLKRSSIVHLCFGISFFTSGLVINFVQFVLFLILKPFNVRLYRYLNYYLCYSFYCQLVFIADWWSGSKLSVYISKEDLETCGKTHGLLLMNHYYEIDWLMGWVFCEKVGVLGNCKAYAKKAIQYLPTIGWAWKFAEFVFLERNYQKDKEIIGRQLHKIMDYPHSGWLLLNAEGTRFTKTKHEASVKFAEEHGLQPLKYHLIPRTKGFTVSVPFLKETGKCPNIYDVNLAIVDEDAQHATFMDLLNGRPVTAHIYLKRYHLKDVPDDEAGAAQWLHNLFRRKDKLQESFHTHGDFFTGSGEERIEPIVYKPSLAGLINTITWDVMTLSFMIYNLAYLLLSGELIYFSIGASIILLFYIMMVKSIGMSKISKASSYGSSPNKQRNGKSKSN
jgi:lysophosphatidic acid acyltransferase/lysophosphatidylinositol acyltransferase